MENKECFHLFNKKYYGGLSTKKTYLVSIRFDQVIDI